MIQVLRKSQVVEQDGLWYHLWVKYQQSGHVEPYHHAVCKLAHSITLFQLQGTLEEISQSA